MYHIFLIHSSANGHLGCFHVLAIVNSAVRNNGVHVSLSNSGFLGMYAQQWDFWVVWQFCSRFWRNLHTVLHSGECSHSGGMFTFLPTVSKGFLFSTPSPAFIVFRPFYGSHSDQHEMEPHCGFHFYFSDNEWGWASFQVFFSHLYYLLWRNVYDFCPLLLGCLFFWYWATWATCNWRLILKGCCWITQIHRDSWHLEEKNSIRGQRRGLIAQSFCVIKFY